MTALIFLFSLLGCGAESTPDPAQPPSQPAAEPAPEQDAAALAECMEAVEGPSVAGECSTDADCEAVGCSGEMCVTKATAASGVMSGCMERPCQALLDTCGCVSGMCSWALKQP